MNLISLDFESYKMDHRTGPSPKPVVLARKINDQPAELIIGLDNMAAAWIDAMMQASNGEAYVIGQNFAFDQGLAVVHLPGCIEPTFAAMDVGNVYDTMLAEKLMNLQQCGVIKEGFVRGVPVKFEYGLDALAESYGVLPQGYADMKHGGDSWRIRYGELDGVPLAAWPDAAVIYPKLDVETTLKVFYAQQERAERIAKSEEDNHHPLTSLSARVRFAFALRITGACGVKVDIERREKARVEALKVVDSVSAFLIEKGVIRPAEDAKPRLHTNKKTGEVKEMRSKTGEVLMKKAVKESADKGELQSYVIRLCEDGTLDPADIVLTDKALEDSEFKRAFEKDVIAAFKDFPQYIAVNAEFMEEHAHKDPLLEAYQTRQSVQKILSTELPRISPELPDKKGVVLLPEGEQWLGIAWPEYDSMKETGRSSSYASKLFPSLNAQNIAKEMRGVYRSHGDDRLLLSHDFVSMELVSAAQTQRNLFGSSVLGDLLNSGGDAHAYLGAQIAYSQWPFFKAISDEEMADSPKLRYQLFLKLKKEEEKLPKWGSDPTAEVVGKDAFKHFRTLGKVTGLALPGGLGAETFVTYAKTTFGVQLNVEEAKQLITVWECSFPEAPKVFDWLQEYALDMRHTINLRVTTHKCFTVENGDGTKRRVLTEETKEKTFTKFVYTTPGGLRRSNCDYCAAANGVALQSPSAEGALTALYAVISKCLKATEGDTFYGVLPYAWVHDECILDVPHEKERVEAVSKELDQIMSESFRKTCPDIIIRTEPGLMKWWSKAAGDDRYEDGSLMTIEEKLAGLKENPR